MAVFAVWISQNEEAEAVSSYVHNHENFVLQLTIFHILYKQSCMLMCV